MANPNTMRRRSKGGLDQFGEGKVPLRGSSVLLGYKYWYQLPFQKWTKGWELNQTELLAMMGYQGMTGIFGLILGMAPILLPAS
jgi:hypothetical protein